MKKPERCSFCGRTNDEVKGGLLTGPGGASICRNCVSICDTLFARNGFPGTNSKSAASADGEPDEFSNQKTNRLPSFVRPQKEQRSGFFMDQFPLTLSAATSARGGRTWSTRP